jgi:hypothetical protein
MRNYKMSEQIFNSTVKEYNDYLNLNSKYFTFLNTLEDIAQYGFTCDFVKTKQQIKEQIEMNVNLLQQKKKIIDSYEDEIREFSICLLVNSDRQVWLNRRNNYHKDFYDYYQSVCGMKEKNETFENCAVREVMEESNININTDDLILIDVHNGFRKFPDGKECLFRTFIYFSIIVDTPYRMEPDKHDE